METAVLAGTGRGALCFRPELSSLHEAAKQDRRSFSSHSSRFV